MAATYGGVELRPQLPPVRDPFAWREAVSVSPASTARGSVCGSSRNPTPVHTPPHTPPGSAREGGECAAPSSRSEGRCSTLESHRNSERNSNDFYSSPLPSTRSSDFHSVYDAQNSARTSDFPVHHEESMAAGYAGYAPAVGSRRGRTGNRTAALAALDAFAPGEGEAALQEEASEVLLDPKHVFSACRHGRHKELEAALIGGFDPMEQDQYGNTLFHIACQNGNKRVAKLAIKYGGDMNAQNLRGQTGLHFLFTYGFTDVAEYFVEKGAREDIRNDAGKCAREGIR